MSNMDETVVELTVCIV